MERKSKGRPQCFKIGSCVSNPARRREASQGQARLRPLALLGYTRADKPGRGRKGKAVIFPIFDNYSLLSNKQYDYLRFRDALLKDIILYDNLDSDYILRAALSRQLYL